MEKEFRPFDECKNQMDAVTICYDSGNCVTCKYFDPKYHGGYCDKHRCDTNPGATCRDYWRG